MTQTITKIFITSVVAGALAVFAACTQNAPDSNTAKPGDNKTPAAQTPGAQAPAGQTPATPGAPVAVHPGPNMQQTPPGRVKVDHILISFAGAGTAAKRSKAEAEKLANEILEKLKSGGGDFASLKRQYSDDPPPGGPYGMWQMPADGKPGDYGRHQMAPAFGDVGFSLAVGGIGMAGFDPAKSPFGWHIIKRVE